MPAHRLSLAERVITKYVVNGETGCWLWTGRIGDDGYGTIAAGADVDEARPRRALRAHRVMYELLVGPIPEGLVIDHLCRVRGCVNPEHLEPVTERINLLRGDTVTARNASVTHCPQGHPYDEANTFRRKNNGRECRECGRERCRRNYRERAAA